MEEIVLKFATMHPVASFEYSAPIWKIRKIANNSEEFTPFTFYSDSYVLAIEFFGGYLEVWEITVRINRQQLSCLELRYCEVVSAFANVGDSKLTDEF